MNSLLVELPWWGFDIGGANIKFATTAAAQDEAATKQAFSVPFELWKYPGRLESQLRGVVSDLPVGARLAITMTGELVDCFPNRKSGVTAIVDAVQAAAENRDVLFYDTSGQWLTSEQAKEDWLGIAAANWHAIANYSARFFDDGNGFLIDIGSTTTDIIPIREGKPAAVGKTDFDRLRSRELCYAGTGRTPICNLQPSFLIKDTVIPTASEFFATIEDALVMTDDVAEDAGNHNTADGRPLTKSFASMRLARMVCEDAERLSEMAIMGIALQTKQALLAKISVSLQAVMQANLDLPPRFTISGQGERLAKTLVETILDCRPEIISWSSRLGPVISKSAAAFAVAALASEVILPPVRPTKLNARLVNNPSRIRVIKIGGSLFDWQSTPQQIESWLTQQPPAKNIWIAGGGPFVDLVRDWHQRVPLNEAAAHRVCLDLMSATIRLANHWFPKWPITQDFEELSDLTGSENIMFDAAQWLQNQESLPESWSMTSDSCAAFIAQHLTASELVLLKSRDAGEANELHDLVDKELVDELLPRFAKHIPITRVINLRDEVFEELSFPGR